MKRKAGQKTLGELAKGTEFGCCAWHYYCEMGKKACYHVEIDNDYDYAKLCLIYKRQQGLAWPPIEGVILDEKPAAEENKKTQQVEVESMVAAVTTMERVPDPEGIDEKEELKEENGQFLLF